MTWTRDWERAFEKLAEAVHKQHIRRASVMNWRECALDVCWIARRITR